MFAVTRLRAQGADGEALAAAVVGAAGRPRGPARVPGRRTRPLGRRPGPVGAGHPMGRRRCYRRALSAAEVKITGAPVWVHALDEPSVYLPHEDIAFGERDA